MKAPLKRVQGYNVRGSQDSGLYKPKRNYQQVEFDKKATRGTDSEGFFLILPNWNQTEA